MRYDRLPFKEYVLIFLASIVFWGSIYGAYLLAPYLP